MSKLTKQLNAIVLQTSLWEAITDEKLDGNQAKWQTQKQITTQKAKTLYLLKQIRPCLWIRIKKWKEKNLKLIMNLSLFLLSTAPQAFSFLVQLIQNYGYKK